jgi:hypothetical protein
MRRLVLGLVLVAALAGCGSDASPRDVVRAWSAALSAGDDERAASLFAPDAVVVQGGDALHLRTHHDALRWNTRLPCSGRIAAMRENGSAVTATFRIGQRRGHRCDVPRGAEAVVIVVVEHGKVVLWDQIGSQIRLGH